MNAPGEERGRRIRRNRSIPEPAVEPILALAFLLVHLYVLSTVLRGVLFTEPFELRAVFAFRGPLGLSNLGLVLSTNALMGILIGAGLVRGENRDRIGNAIRIGALLLLTAYTAGLLLLVLGPPNTPLHLPAAGLSQVRPLLLRRFVVVCSRGRK